MLYTKKDVEKIFSDLVADYIAKGARIDFDNNNYTCSEYDTHVDLIDNSGAKIIIYKTCRRGERDAFVQYDRGLCEIIVSHCKPFGKFYGKFRHRSCDKEETVVYTFYQFKDVYTDDLETYNRMNDLSRCRKRERWNFERHKNSIPYNDSVILSIVHRRKGYKRIGASSIDFVEKKNGKYYIHINSKGTIVIGT